MDARPPPCDREPCHCSLSSVFSAKPERQRGTIGWWHGQRYTVVRVGRSPCRNRRRQRTPEPARPHQFRLPSANRTPTCHGACILPACPKRPRRRQPVGQASAGVPVCRRAPRPAPPFLRRRCNCEAVQSRVRLPSAPSRATPVLPTLLPAPPPPANRPRRPGKSHPIRPAKRTGARCPWSARCS